jgi:hypothetical protein
MTCSHITGELCGSHINSAALLRLLLEQIRGCTASDNFTLQRDIQDMLESVGKLVEIVS